MWCGYSLGLQEGTREDEQKAQARCGAGAPWGRGEGGGRREGATVRKGEG